MDDDTLMAAIEALVVAFAPAGAALDPAAGGRAPALVADLGYDSVRIVELALACEERFGTALDLATLLATDPTARDLAAQIRGQQP